MSAPVAAEPFAGRDADAPRHLVLVGATASGKSSLALELAEEHDLDIVSMDSMQVYRGMDIGTAKPSAADRRRVRHHLLDVRDPEDDWTVADHRRAVEELLAADDRPMLLVGGTGLYVRAVVDELDIPGRYPETRAELELEADTEALHRRLSELDPVAASRMEPTNRRRVLRALEVTIGSGRPFSEHGPGLATYPPSDRFVMAGVITDRALLDRRIAARFAEQMAAGFLDEVRGLVDRMGRTASQALGYRELAAHLRGEQRLDAAVEEAIGRTRRFARRQERWFRRDPRIIWLRYRDDPAELLDALDVVVPG